MDRVKSRLDLARELGATHVINTSNLPSLTVDLAKAIREIATKGTNANIDTTGVIPIIDAGVQSLHSRGQMILIGIVNGQMNVDLGPMMMVCTCTITGMTLLTIASSVLVFAGVSRAARNHRRYDDGTQ